MPPTIGTMTRRATLELAAVCLDANDPGLVARFWAEALRWNIDGDDPDAVRLVPTDATRFPIVLRKVVAEKVGQNRQHFDLTTTSIEDQDDTVARLIEVGGRHVDIGQTAEEDHVVLTDPDGNELCVLAPNNNFLAGCERLGSVNCDGTKELGYFWSEALGWPLVWDEDDETAIRAPDLTGPLITWSGPPLMPMLARNRIHLHVVPASGVSQDAEVERLVGLGASPVDIGQDDPGPSGPGWLVMADPDGNEFCVVAPAATPSRGV